MFSWIIYGLAWLCGWFLLWRITNFKEVTPVPDNNEKIRLSVIIPARNEEKRIGRLIDSLKKQVYFPFEVIVVNDHSIDRTAQAVQQAGFKIVESADLPAGWLGKNWACWQGAQAAKGDCLIFLDADTCLEDGGLGRIVKAWRKTGGLLTIQPDHITLRSYEQFSSFFNIVLISASNAFTLLGKKIKAGSGFGPCVICSREDYFSTGGHSSVRGTVLESISLVHKFNKNSLPVQCAVGRGAISFRMYPGGYKQMLEGWTKGFGSGAMMIRPWATVMISLWITGCFGGYVRPLRLLFEGNIILAMFVYMAFMLQIGWMLARIGKWQLWTVLLFPIPLTYFALVMLRSLLMIYVFGNVSWHGRKISTSRRVKK